MTPREGGGGGGGGVVGLVAYAALAVVALRVVLSYKSVAHAVRRMWRWADEWAQAYQYYEVPRFGGGGGEGVENPLFRKAAAYVAALPSLEDADAACVLSSACKTNDFSLQLGPGHTAHDAFLGARLAWTNAGPAGDGGGGRERLVLRWTSAPFTHPATLETVAMDPELKARVRADLESFLKGRAYYHRLGRAWRRSYLLYGPSGTGKSTFAAAMARFLVYDVYDIDMSRGGCDDLRALLLETTPRSLILVEDLDRYLRGGGDGETSAARTSRMLSFMDGLSSCCGEERVMVFTMSGDKDGVDPAILRPGRLDVHIHFTMCDFEGFKTLASNYLGLKDHKLYPQVEEGFHAAGARLSPAELGEIMLANRGSPSRALRTVINALQHVAPAPAPPQQQPRASSASRPPPRLTARWSGHLDEASAADASAANQSPGGGGGGFGKDAPMREFKKLYGLIKIRSRKDGGVVPVDDTASANGRGSDVSADKDR
ncbi:hypothetical protein OsJ_32176 [Oryza sativa Japonica Group]|uniref:AAA+ ATPase domain-containing protein n=1 Tax=Oryza sativa subsp. japonica TaxID=39947 RepID=B9G6M9_ORYSJ|nr:hypothetical protein OsJ_32176 [Oryza sativa Japonica Group]